MGTMQTWRKAYGALKDQTKVGLAHVNSDYKVVISYIYIFFISILIVVLWFYVSLVSNPVD